MSTAYNRPGKKGVILDRKKRSPAPMSTTECIEYFFVVLKIFLALDNSHGCRLLFDVFSVKSIILLPLSDNGDAVLFQCMSLQGTAPVFL